MKMKISETRLRRIIHEELLREQKEEDVDFDLGAMNLPFAVPMKLKKLLDPKITPQKFFKLDQELDETGTTQHQAFAVLAFALTYADMNFDETRKLLSRASQMINKLKGALEKQEEAGETKDMSAPAIEEPAPL